jgi:hypothetical protein
LPERAPNVLVADKAYDSDAIRNDLKQRGIRAVIPPKSKRTKTICYNRWMRWLKKRGSSTTRSAPLPR